MTTRWLLPLLLVAVFLIGAAGALVVERGVFISATPTPTSLPTSTPTPRSTATVTVVYVTTTPQPSSISRSGATATSKPGPTATSRPGTTATTTTSSDPVSADLATIRAHGYTPHGSGASTPDGAGGTLYAWLAVCTGSADGYCQKVFFFIDARYLGTDTAHASNAISKIEAAGAQNIAVTYPSYGPQDPLCCPSGKLVTITYHWNGSRLIPSGTPPGH